MQNETLLKIFLPHQFQIKCCTFLGIAVLIFIWCSSSMLYGTAHLDIGWLQNMQQQQSEQSCAKIEHKNDWSRMCRAKLIDEEIGRLLPGAADKYIFATWGGLCGGIGNQIWRFASLYGIGKPYGRKPIFKEDQKCGNSNDQHKTDDEREMERLFPVYASQLNYIKANEVENDTFHIKGFAPGCCAYEDPQKRAISRIKDKFIKIDGHYFQSYKFFENRRTEIRQIFQFGQELCQAVDAYKKELFLNDQAHKFCIHIRIGDFQKFGIETKKDFTERAIEFGFEYLKKKFADVSVVLLGLEKQFLMDLKINRQLIPKVYLPKAMSRSNDLAFATTACDSLLITASSSTFSWWMAYLMPDDATIFYNSKFEGTPYVRENFLADWIPIKLTNGTMALD